LYFFLIILTRYFSKDFLNKTNPRIIYQENEFVDNFTIPINFILQSYYYEFSFETNENIFNLSSSEEYKEIYNQKNNFFDFNFIIRNPNISKTDLSMIDKINIFSRRDEVNGSIIFRNFVFKNESEKQIFNLKLFSEKLDLYGYNPKFDFVNAENGILYDDFNLTISSNIEFSFNFKNNKIIKNAIFAFFEIINQDSIINVNNPDFFLNYDITKNLKFDNNLEIKQLINANYAVAKLIDDYGFIFSDKSEKFTLKKNFDSIVSNLYNIGTIFKFELSPILNQYERIYKKLQNVFADLGGLFNALTMIGNILVLQFNKKRFYYELINKTFFMENEHSNKNINFNLTKNNHIGENLVIDSKTNNNYKNQINDKFSQKVQSVLSIKSSINKDNNNLDKASMIINNPKTNNKNIYKNSFNLIDDNSFIKNESMIQTKRINDSSTTRLNIDLQEFKSKEERIPEEINQDKNSKDANIIENDKILKERIEVYLENNKKRKNRKKFVKLSKFEFFLKFFPCKRFKKKTLIEKEILISKAEDKIAEYLDVCSYTSLIENVHKLKIILLNNFQKLSFEHMKNRNPSDLFKENYDDKIFETIQYYKQKIKESNLNEHDKKLLELFSKEFKELILS